LTGRANTHMCARWNFTSIQYRMYRVAIELLGQSITWRHLILSPCIGSSPSWRTCCCGCCCWNLRRQLCGASCPCPAACGGRTYVDEGGSAVVFGLLGLGLCRIAHLWISPTMQQDQASLRDRGDSCTPSHGAPSLGTNSHTRTTFLNAAHLHWCCGRKATV